MRIIPRFFAVHVFRALILVYCFGIIAHPRMLFAQNLFGPSGALRFDGVDDYVVVSSNSSLALSNRATFEAWINPQAQAFGTILSRGHGGNNLTDYILQVVDAGGLRLQFFAADAWHSSVATVPSNVWTHVAVTFDGTNKQFFINGVLDTTVGSPGAFYASGSALNIGRQGSVCNCNLFKGQMDEVRVWNIVRTPAEISQSMKRSLAGTDLGLAAYYRFDHITGVTTRDSSPNGNRGTLVNRPVPLPSTVPFPLLVTLNGPNPLTNDCGVPFADPGATVRAAPVAFSGDANINVVLKPDGTVMRWFLNNVDPLAPNATNLAAVAISAFSLAAGLRPNGTVLVWGNTAAQTNVPSSATNAVAVAMSYDSTLALRADGTVLAWGNNVYGVTNIPGSVTNVVGIAGGYNHAVALRADGTVVAWGSNSDGQLNVPAGLTNVIAIAAGSHHTLALRANGTVAAWGYVDSGSLNIPSSVTNVVAISASFNSSLALKVDGSVVSWGGTARPIPAGATNIVAIGGGEDSMLLRADGTILRFFNPIPTEATAQSVPVIASGTVNPAVFGNYPIAYAATNSTGGTGATNRLVVVADITPPSIYLLGDNPLRLAVGDAFVDPGATATDQCAGGMTGSLVTAGVVNIAVPGRYQRTYTVTDPQGNTRVMTRAVLVLPAPFFALNGPNPLTNECHFPFVDPGAGSQGPPLALAAGVSQSFVVTASRTVRGWGDTNFGVLNIPPEATNVIAVASSLSFATALRADGTLLRWGDDAPFNPIPAEATNIIAIACDSAGRLLALKANGTLVGSGSVPAIPSGMSNVIQAALGSGHAVALKADGTVVAWGDNSYGRTNIPADAMNIVAVTAGSFHGLAIKADGTVVAWGYNNVGQTNVPASATNVVAIAAGGDHNLALKADGTVVAWGNNDVGQTNVPTSATNIVAISAGFSYNLALRADGAIIAWGRHAFGPPTVVPADINQVASATVSGTVNTNAPGNYLLTYTGPPGSVPPQLTRTVVVNDKLRPTLALLGTNPMALVVGSAFVDPGATASDLCAGNLTGSIVPSGTVNTLVPGIYTRTYTVTDPGGNSTASNRTVVVLGAPSFSGFASSLIGTNPDTAAVTAQIGAIVSANGLPATAYLQYGLSTSYSVSSAPVTVAGFATSNVTLTANLSRGVVYHWRAMASNSVGVTLGPDQTLAIPSLFAAGDVNGDGIVSEGEIRSALSNYFPTSPWLYLTNVAGLGESNVTFRLTNSLSGAFSVESTTNLVDWFLLGPATPRYEFTDTNAPAGQRYYRLRWP